MPLVPPTEQASGRRHSTASSFINDKSIINSYRCYSVHTTSEIMPTIAPMFGRNEHDFGKYWPNLDRKVKESREDGFGK